MVGALVASAPAIGLAPAAQAEPCPDAEVVFARGSDEPPGLGTTGQAFVDALRAQSAGKSIGVYPVNYPATGDFENKAVFPATMFDGVGDAAARVRATAANCPNTKIIVGGYSQGAAVAAYATADLPANIAPAFAGKSLDLCAPADNICDGSPASLLGSLAHATYPYNGLVGAAAAAAAGRIA